MKASENKYGVDLLKYYMYIFEADSTPFDNLNYKNLINVTNPAESFALMLTILFNDLIHRDILYEDYVKVIDTSLPYVRGKIDLKESIRHNSFSRQELYQKVKVKSKNIPVNLCIIYCLDTILKHDNIKSNKDFCTFAHKIRKDSGINIDEYTLSKSNTRYFNGVVSSCLNSDFYEPYVAILRVCNLYLKSLYLNDIEDINDSNFELFDFRIEKFMEAFTQTAFRHVMLSLSKDEIYSKFFKGNWRMWKSDRNFKTSGLRLEIVVKYLKNCNFSHLLVDCKTNDTAKISNVSGAYNIRENRAFMQTYLDEYEGETGEHNNVGVLFHYVPTDEYSKVIDRLNDTYISTSSEKKMLVHISKLDADRDPKDIEVEIKDLVLKLSNITESI